jgi:hypothetical protein
VLPEIRNAMYDSHGFLQGWAICCRENIPSCRPAGIKNLASISSGAEGKVETCRLRKGTEVVVAREQGHAAVNAALGNQHVTKASFAAL